MNCIKRVILPWQITVMTFMKSIESASLTMTYSLQEEDPVATHGVQAQHRGHLERHPSPQRVGRDRQALHPVREPPGCHPCGCRPPQRALGPECIKH